MKHILKWQAFLVTATVLCMSLVGCNSPQNTQQEEVEPTAPVVTDVATNDSIYNNAYEVYNNLTDLGVAITSPKEEELSSLETLETFEYNKDAIESTLIIPKYNGTKITVCSVEYTGERYIVKDELYSIDSTPDGYGLLVKANRPEGMAQIAVYVTYKEKNVQHLIATTNGKDGTVDREYLNVDSEQVKPQEGTPILPEANPDTYLEGLVCFDRYTVDMDKDGSNETIEVYCDREISKDGKYLLDDGQTWALMLRKGEEVYPLFEKSYIQLGGIEYTVYEDYEDYGRTHIMVRYNSGAGIMYYDCTYDEESGYIIRKSLYEAGNINKMNEWSYKDCD